MFYPYLRLIRLPLIPTAVADSFVGYGIVRGGFGTADWSVVAALAGVSACLYAFGMVLNDWADREHDRKYHPDRPLPSGQVPLPAAAALMILLLCGWAVLAVFLSPDGRLAAGAVLLFILAYDGLLKRFPIPGSLAMGLCRGGNLSMGILAAGGALFSGTLWIPPLILTLYVAGVTWISTHEERLPHLQPVVGRLLRGIIPLDGLLAILWGALLWGLSVLLLIPLQWLLRKIKSN